MEIRQRYPNQAAAAKALGITQPYFSELLQNRRPFSDRILTALGLERIVVKREPKGQRTPLKRTA